MSHVVPQSRTKLGHGHTYITTSRSAIPLRRQRRTWPDGNTYYHPGHTRYPTPCTSIGKCRPPSSVHRYISTTSEAYHHTQHDPSVEVHLHYRIRTNHTPSLTFACTLITVHRNYPQTVTTINPINHGRLEYTHQIPLRCGHRTSHRRLQLIQSSRNFFGRKHGYWSRRIPLTGINDSTVTNSHVTRATIDAANTASVAPARVSTKVIRDKLLVPVAEQRFASFFKAHHPFFCNSVIRRVPPKKEAKYWTDTQYIKFICTYNYDMNTWESGHLLTHTFIPHF